MADLSKPRCVLHLGTMDAVTNALMCPYLDGHPILLLVLYVLPHFVAIANDTIQICIGSL